LHFDPASHKWDEREKKRKLTFRCGVGIDVHKSISLAFGHGGYPSKTFGALIKTTKRISKLSVDGVDVAGVPVCTETL
jgi:hypothetical protein